jgi:hypothetical protein
MNGPCKSSDQVLNLITSLISDVYTSLGLTSRVLRNTTEVVTRRTRQEGLGFLTKTLPRLGKCLDQALTSQINLTKERHGFSTWSSSTLPRFLGELFELVFDSKTGSVLPNPDVRYVSALREILFVFYKLDLPYSSDQEQGVLDQFVRTDSELRDVNSYLSSLSQELDMTIAQSPHQLRRKSSDLSDRQRELIVLRRARVLLARLFSRFDPRDICPRHGPGAVATKQKHRDKFIWTNISSRLTDYWPLDAYFYASNGHVCDSFRDFSSLGDDSLAARVILVPKDSRGPRLISCEPVDFQWIQQGLQRALYNLVETSNLTRFNVFFTNQEPNRFAALYGSSNGKYATLDLKEASDRVSTGLVSALFPEHVRTALFAARTDRTQLPNGSEVPLLKFAPMGSAICFPILALSIWSLLAAAATDKSTRESTYVYGDDVIVPTAFAADAITILERFGLLVNKPKSCTSGFFRESCGMDAFKGVDVTPVRIRRPWRESPSPDTYESWISYANSFLKRKRYRVYDFIVEALERVYGPIPTSDMHLACPSLDGPVNLKRFKRRTNFGLQLLEYRVRVTQPLKVRYRSEGWPELLRYFTEKAQPVSPTCIAHQTIVINTIVDNPSSVSVYTRRRATKLSWTWRSPQFTPDASQRLVVMGPPHTWWQSSDSGIEVLPVSND